VWRYGCGWEWSGGGGGGGGRGENGKRNVELPAAFSSIEKNASPDSHKPLTSSFFTMAHGGAGPRCSRGERGDMRERERERGLPSWTDGGICGDADGRLVIVADFATVRSILEGLCRRRPLLTHDVFRPEVEAPAKEEEKDMVIIRSGKREKIIVPFLCFSPTLIWKRRPRRKKKETALHLFSLLSTLRISNRGEWGSVTHTRARAQTETKKSGTTQKRGSKKQSGKKEKGG
jgi:hypothetical protein